MPPRRIVVLGGGFAGLWAAVGAARKLDELRIGPESVEITLINADAYHSIRVRNYESDLTPLRVPLDDVLAPLGVERIEGQVIGLDAAQRKVMVNSSVGQESLSYDRLVFALGSRLVRPELPGLDKFAFDVDTYRGAHRLQTHLQSLAHQPPSPGRFTAIVVGAGLTGIETACELTERLEALIAAAKLSDVRRVILVDHHPQVGSDMGDSARPVIEQALRSLGVETRLGVRITAIDANGVQLQSGERISAATVIWCAGLRANSLTEQIPVFRDRFGRVPVDEFLRVTGVPHVFAAGDVAAARVDAEHDSVMSCQHGRPMGRFAGHNVVCDLLGLPMLPLHIEWYVTVLDLGRWGAVYTEGWDRRVFLTGEAAKKIKRSINGIRIYPPLTRNRADIFAAAEPLIQSPPSMLNG